MVLLSKPSRFLMTEILLFCYHSRCEYEYQNSNIVLPVDTEEALDWRSNYLFYSNCRLEIVYDLRKNSVQVYRFAVHSIPDRPKK